MKLENVILPAKRDNRLWDIEVKDGYIHTISPSARKENVNCSLLLPALCHPHIHIDKSYILTCNIQPTSADQPDYTDLAPRSGSFSEALVNTSQAKARYTFDDLYLRGSQLLATSYRQGVTSLRAFVELDHVTKTLPLRVAINLKQDFAHLVEVQICAFAQDALFSTEHGEANRSIITSALQEYSSDIEVLGTTPYVENSLDSSTENIEWAITTALKYNIHLDFHLDYNLDPPSSKTPLVYTVIELLQKQEWLRRAGKKRTIVLGHCTQLTVLQNSDLASLATEIRSSGLPIHFVGLPTSDIFMMGRPMPGIQSAATSQVRPRATLQVLSMIKDFGFSACFGVNNVGNAFTPFGTGDPIQLASFGVGIYQAGTAPDAELLYSCISWRARAAIGLEDEVSDGEILEGAKWQPMLLITNEEHWHLPGHTGSQTLEIPAKRRVRLQDVVWDPPDAFLRSVVR